MELDRCRNIGTKSVGRKEGGEKRVSRLALGVESANYMDLRKMGERPLAVTISQVGLLI
jgi:hypothetical protein